MNFFNLAKLFSVALIAATAANAENVLRWTSQGDALTMDPHSQNESPTIAFNGQIYEALVARDISRKLDSFTRWVDLQTTSRSEIS